MHITLYAANALTLWVFCLPVCFIFVCVTITVYSTALIQLSLLYFLSYYIVLSVYQSHHSLPVYLSHFIHLSISIYLPIYLNNAQSTTHKHGRAVDSLLQVQV